MLLLITVSIVELFRWALNVSTYWKRHNMPHLPALPFLGNFKDIALFTKCFREKISDFYFDKRVLSSPAFGIHIFYKPTIFLREPELIKRILVKDFNSFSDR